MYIRWQYRRRKYNQCGPGGEPDARWSAVLVENERVDGQPKQRHIAYLVGFTESAVRIINCRCDIWDTISAKLDELSNRMTAIERKKIEAAIATKLLPRLTAAEYKEVARGYAGCTKWELLTDKQRAILADEAEHWQRPRW